VGRDRRGIVWVLFRDHGQISDRVASVGSDALVASVGAGLYLSIGGAVVGLVACIAAIQAMD
jgi:hypothetical protein